MIYIKKRVILIIALLSLLYCISSIVTTYSKYVSKATGEFIANIAKWDIKVNDEQITTNSLHTVEITPTFAGNENLKEGVIAPTAVGYFDIIIDATNVDVSFNYEITISENAEIPDLKIKSYEAIIDGVGAGETTISSDHKITDDILLTDTNRTKTIRVYVEWIDGTGATMNNSDDTNITINNESISLSASIKLTQIA